MGDAVNVGGTLGVVAGPYAGDFSTAGTADGLAGGIVTGSSETDRLAIDDSSRFSFYLVLRSANLA